MGRVVRGRHYTSRFQSDQFDSGALQPFRNYITLLGPAYMEPHGLESPVVGMDRAMLCPRV